MIRAVYKDESMNYETGCLLYSIYLRLERYRAFSCETAKGAMPKLAFGGAKYSRGRYENENMLLIVVIVQMQIHSQHVQRVAAVFRRQRPVMSAGQRMSRKSYGASIASNKQ